MSDINDKLMDKEIAKLLIAEYQQKAVDVLFQDWRCRYVGYAKFRTYFSGKNHTCQIVYA